MKCKRCGHIWKKYNKPSKVKWCPSCKSINWDEIKKIIKGNCKFCGDKCKRHYNYINYIKKGNNQKINVVLQEKLSPFGYKDIRIDNNFLKKHRVIMENWLRENEPNSEFLVEIDGTKYLKPEVVVHHIDCNRLNNEVENLYCFHSKGEHTKYHREIQNLVNLIVYESDINILLREIKKYNEFIKLSKLSLVLNKCYTTLYRNIKKLLMDGFLIINNDNNNKFALEVFLSHKGINHINYLEGLK